MNTVRPRQPDAGFTLVEMIIAIVLLGLVATVLGAVTITVLRVTPPTQFRTDDSRSTRGMQTWMARDIASTPPNDGVVAGEGGFIFSGASPNSCGATGTLVTYMTWIDAQTSEQFHANYFIDGTGAVGRVSRTVCSSAGFGPVSSRLTTEISRSTCGSAPLHATKVLTALDPDGVFDDVQAVNFCFVAVEQDTGLNGGGGITREIRLTVSSRNYVETL